MSERRHSFEHSLRVWDLPTRLYHWLQAVLAAAALATGYLAPAWWLDIHVLIGTALAGLVLFRLVWGVFGPEFSRFTNFLCSPRRIIDDLRSRLSGQSHPTVGHNPLGGLMVIGLIGTIAAILVSGLFVLGGVENQGPLAAFIGFAKGDTAGTAHSLLAVVLLVLVTLHLLGVIAENRLSRQRLVRAMITGRKLLPAGTIPLRLRPAHLRAGILATIGSSAVFGVAALFASRMPASGLIAMPQLPAFQAECGACHQAYHPSLLPRASWAAMMAGLDDHFGEDARLMPAVRDEVAAYLGAYASEAWDTEAANRLRTVDPAEPARITATPFWARTHRLPSPSVFESRSVRGPGNCNACHRDAASGRFDDQMIAVPAQTGGT